MNLPYSRALIVGCGDIGQRVAQRLLRMQLEVQGVVRSDDSAQLLNGAGIRPVRADLDATGNSASAPLVLYFTPPPDAGKTDPRLRRWLGNLVVRPQRVVYISTSGVYGDCEGRWIDEDEPLKPRADRAHRRLDAERALKESGLDVVILRVPGIYGPGRLPVERLLKGLPLIRPEESPYTNRIHGDDLAEAAVHAAAYGRTGQAYNIADGAPTTMTDYFCRCARKLNLPAPPLVSYAEAQKVFTPAMWSFMEESKRLRTERMRGQLRFTPRYPSLEQGLAATPLP